MSLTFPGRKKRSVRFTLFLSYTLLILTVITFLLTFYFFFTSRMLKDNAIDTLRNQSNALINTVDAELNKMNILSMNISFSRLLKELIVEHLSFPVEPNLPEVRTAKYLNTTRITDVLESLIGPFKPVPQINYYDFRGEMIGAGVFSGSAKRHYTELDWTRNMDFTGGKKLLSPPHEDELIGNTFAIYKKQQYISLYRSIFDSYNNPVGIVEVKQFSDVIFKDFSKIAENVIVLDGANRQLFPVDGAIKAGRAEMLTSLEENEPTTLTNSGTGRKEMLIVRSSRQSDWKLIVIKEQRILLRPVYDFTVIILLSTLFFLGVAVFIAFRFARRLIVPLRHIHDTINDLDWKMVSNGEPSGIPSDLNELEEIEAAIIGMREKLQESIQEIINARTQELQATMFALQAQMDPHFIYNILTTIGIMAEEGLHDDIGEVIDNLTHLLRYISSGKSRYVKLREEIEYSRRYLACMKIRFQENLNFSISVPDEILEVRVPKLIIQPLIENTMKYGINSEPPWNVTISGKQNNSGWEVHVQDNGPGFGDENLLSLYRGIEKIQREGIDRELQINGMGLLNIYARLSILYGDNAVFSIDNGDSDEGAGVTIGGSYEPRKKI